MRVSQNTSIRQTKETLLVDTVAWNTSLFRKGFEKQKGSSLNDENVQMTKSTYLILRELC